MTSGRFPLRLMETFRSVFYTPIYVSLTGGFLENEGLDVTFETCPPRYAHPLSALNHGAADITQSGIMRSIIAFDWGAESVPKHVAKINSRDGFFVLSRPGSSEFRWENLRGARVIPVGFSPMPWASFQFAMRRHDVSPQDLELLPGLSLDDAVAAFRTGGADFIHVPEPAAEQLIADGVAQLAVALGPENGHVAYSSFAATNRFISENADVVSRFVQGFARALTWLVQSDAAQVGESIASFFPEVDRELITQAVARYKSQDTWPSHPALEPPEYEGLQEILMAAGLVQESQPYEKVVSPEFAQGV
jgi:NitT/TauT family transport system substrate-binding protein